MKLLFLTTLILMATASVHSANPFLARKGVIVHLFQWKWLDIAKECEEFLSPNGYEVVQISPPNEHIIVRGPVMRPWWERYQPVSYKLESRSGTKEELQEMLDRCNEVDIKVIADVVLNHMTGPEGFVGTAGSQVNYGAFQYPSFTTDDFHTPPCDIKDDSNAHEVRFCQLKGMRDLDQLKDNVRDRQVEYLNKLISMGVAGFRIVAAKHMWPSDLKAIFDRLDNLGGKHLVPPGTRPFIYHDLADYGNEEAIKWSEYKELGLVTDYRYGVELFERFIGAKPLYSSQGLAKERGMIPNNESIVFVGNHDTQRKWDKYEPSNKPVYKMLIAFMLAYPLGTPQILSDYYFKSKEAGPPHDDDYNILSPHPIEDNVCKNQWACEHRWRQISNMVLFRLVASYHGVSEFQSVGFKQIAFSRGDKAFIAFNANRSAAMKTEIQTRLPEGKYCDVISGYLKDNKCTGKTIEVKWNSKALIEIPELDTFNGDIESDNVVAIHVKAKLRE